MVVAPHQLKSKLSIPVISNGNVRCWSDVVHNLRHTGADGIMCAESILANPALFLPASARWNNQSTTAPRDINSALNTNSNDINTITTAVESSTDTEVKTGNSVGCSDEGKRCLPPQWRQGTATSTSTSTSSSIHTNDTLQWPVPRKPSENQPSNEANALSLSTSTSSVSSASSNSSAIDAEDPRTRTQWDEGVVSNTHPDITEEDKAQLDATYDATEDRYNEKVEVTVDRLALASEYLQLASEHATPALWIRYHVRHICVHEVGNDDDYYYYDYDYYDDDDGIASSCFTYSSIVSPLHPFLVCFTPSRSNTLVSVCTFQLMRYQLRDELEDAMTFEEIERVVLKLHVRRDGGMYM